MSTPAPQTSHRCVFFPSAFRCGGGHRRGMTLVEVLVSAAILAILMGGMASAVVLTSRAVPTTSATRSEAEVQASVARALDQMEADLLCAKTITELTATSITMTVADRGHGTAGDETIRYAWSGVVGDPLTRQYNSGTAMPIVEKVRSLVLSSTTAATWLQSPPRVMLVVGNSASLSANDQARVALLNLWQFPTTIVDDGANAAVFAAAALASDVAWYGSDITGTSIYGTLPNPSIGVVIEKNTLYAEFGFSALAAQTLDKKIQVLDTSHEITSGFALGSLDVMSSAQMLTYATGTRASGARLLAGRQGVTTDPVLMALDVGGAMHNSQKARGRRVALPWGGSTLTPLVFSQMTSDGQWLLKRTIVWAAAPVVHQSVSVGIRAGRAVEGQRVVRLLNEPGVSKP